MVRWLLLGLVACREPVAGPPDAPGNPEISSTCTGVCQLTTLSADFFVRRVLDHAVFGIKSIDSTLHVEAYRGGDGACPSEISPTPDYTLVLGKVAPPNGTTATSSPGNVLDFVGDLLNGELGAQALTVIVQAVAANLNDFVALDVGLDFEQGTVTGHLYATHCDSLDSP